MRGTPHWVAAEGNAVVLCNEENPVYYQAFEGPAELFAFIAELLDAAQEAWGDRENPYLAGEELEDK